MAPHGAGLAFIAARQQNLGPFGQDLRIIGGDRQDLVIQGDRLPQLTARLIECGAARQIFEVRPRLKSEAASQGHPSRRVPQNGMDVDYLPQHLFIFGLEGDIAFKIG